MTRAVRLIPTSEENRFPDEATRSAEEADAYQRGIVDSTRWRGPWQAGTYEKNDQVLVNGWLMIANKQTSENAQPQPGVEGYITDVVGSGAPSFTRQTVAEGLWLTGQEYLFPAGGVFNGYKITLPANSENFRYGVWLRSNRGQFNERLIQLLAPFAGPSVQTAYEFSAGANILLPGERIELFLTAAAVTQANTFNGYWDVKNSNGSPGEGEAYFQSNNTEIRIHKTDENDVDQTANMEAVEAGGTLAFAGSTWTITEVDIRGSHVRYHLIPDQGRPSENKYTLTFTWGSADPIPYLVDVDYWQPLSIAEINGFEGDALDNLVANQNQYGIDLYATQLIEPTDWDVQAYSG